MSVPPALLPHFAPLSGDYDVILCDIWGVVHNGVVSFAHACDALMRARARGIAVVFVTNAPRPSPIIMTQLERLKVPREAYDAIVTSGDVTRGVIAQRPGQSIYHLGPTRDRTIFTDMRVNVALSPLATADYVVCSGLDDDDNNKPEDYRAELELMLARKLFMVCGNPDVVVDRGDRLVYCAGAVADLYQTMGGEVFYAGKPYRPIYDMALAKAEEALGRKAAPGRVVAIGDSVRTDLRGAHGMGFDFVFITSGIHAEELGGRERPDPVALGKIFAGAGEMPKAVMRELVW